MQFGLYTQQIFYDILYVNSKRQKGRTHFQILWLSCMISLIVSWCRNNYFVTEWKTPAHFLSFDVISISVRHGVKGSHCTANSLNRSRMHEIKKLSNISIVFTPKVSCLHLIVFITLSATDQLNEGLSFLLGTPYTKPDWANVIHTSPAIKVWTLPESPGLSMHHIGCKMISTNRYSLLALVTKTVHSIKRSMHCWQNKFKKIKVNREKFKRKLAGWQKLESFSF